MGHNPFLPDRRSTEERNEDEAREFAEVVLDEIVERFASAQSFTYRVGYDVLADQFVDLLAGTDLSAKIRKRFVEIGEDRRAELANRARVAQDAE